MKVIECKQGSPEWLMFRAGLPTSSNFHKIVTPTGKLSKQSRDYKHFLLAERVMKAPIVEHVSVWMQRGTEFEQTASDFYSLMRDDIKTEPVGLIVTDDERIGASPDRLAGDDGLLEIKVPAPNTLMGYYLDPESFEQEYKVQVYGQMLVTERQWCDLLAFSPDGLPPVIRTFKRDVEFLEILGKSVREFSDALEADTADLVKRGIIQQ